MAIKFEPPVIGSEAARHHAQAAAGNIQVTTAAIAELDGVLSGVRSSQRILLKAAAGAGKSYALRRMVASALQHDACGRVGVVAFKNKQITPLAEGLGRDLGREKVCLLVANGRAVDVPESTKAAAVVVEAAADVPSSAQVIVATTHKVGGFGTGHLRKAIGNAAGGDYLFDVLFVDEAWELALHLYRKVKNLAPVCVGVGDVGQLPPIDSGQNPWRGDRRYNPYRAWPTKFEDDPQTWSRELPAVWRPTAAQLPLWRSFYGDWDSLDCVASPGDRSITVNGLRGPAAEVWRQVATGVPTLVEVDGLEEPEAADVDMPLLLVVEMWLDRLLGAGFTLDSMHYDDAGLPVRPVQVRSDKPTGDHLITVLATRNQAVDDAMDMVDRLTAKHRLPDGVITASTVDSWQGRTNGITVALHPLSGASALDEFNSAFGRLAVTCTRATHGLLMVSRAGLTDLLANAPARPGTPLGEPGTRQLPRQTHQRILQTFARGTYTV